MEVLMLSKIQLWSFVLRESTRKRLPFLLSIVVLLSFAKSNYVNDLFKSDDRTVPVSPFTPTPGIFPNWKDWLEAKQNLLDPGR
jgi:hypothetical protein